MRKLFPQHKKERVEKINELGEVVPPGHVQGSQADVAEIDESQGRLNIFFFFNIKLFFSTIFIFKGFFGVLQKTLKNHSSLSRDGSYAELCFVCHCDIRERRAAPLTSCIM